MNARRQLALCAAVPVLAGCGEESRRQSPAATATATARATATPAATPDANRAKRLLTFRREGYSGVEEVLTIRVDGTAELERHDGGRRTERLRLAPRTLARIRRGLRRLPDRPVAAELPGGGPVPFLSLDHRGREYTANPADVPAGLSRIFATLVGVVEG